MPTAPQEYYTVKQTSKILGYSTNSIYKFLNNERLKASRGHSEQGRFRIPKSSLDEFFGGVVPQSYINERLAPPKPKQVHHQIEAHYPSSAPAPVPVPNTPRTGIATRVNLKLARVLILISLSLIIADVLLSHDFSLLPQLFRLTLIGIIVYITYQFESQVLSENIDDTSRYQQSTMQPSANQSLTMNS